jgi:hypothetical protein
MGFEDIGKKVEEVKGKIDAALEKTDIDDKIMANSDQIKKGAGTVLDKTDIDDKIKDKVEGIVDKFKMGKKDDDTQNA